MFTRRTLQRRGEVPRVEKIAIYDKTGILQEVYDTATEAANDTFLYSGVTAALRSGKVYKEHFFRKFPEDEIPEQIDVPYLCEVDGIRFIKQIELVKYFGVSRQAVSQTVKKRGKTICGKIITWNEE